MHQVTEVPCVARASSAGKPRLRGRSTRTVWGLPFQVLPPSGPHAGFDRHGAARPAVLREPGRVLQVWYAGDDGTTRRILHAVQRPTHGWSRRGPAVEPGLAGATDAAGVASPSVVRTPDGFLMAYVGTDGTTARAHLATSTDGEAWVTRGAITVRGGPPGPAGTPCLVQDADGLWLYQGGLGPDGRPAIHLARPTADPSAWDHRGVVLEADPDDLGVTDPWVVADPDGTLTLFFVAHGEGGRTAIRAATSTDHLRWDRRPDPIGAERRHHDGGALGHPSAARLHNGDLRLWYTATAESRPDGAWHLWSTDLLYAATP